MDLTKEFDSSYITNKAEEANSFISLDSNETTSHRSIVLYCGHSGHKRILTLKCSDRTCAVCRKKIYFKLFKNWFQLAESMLHPKLLTLTTVNVKELTREHLKFIRASFVKLMRRKYYKDRIKGGLYALELKNIGNGWNIHIHALIETLSGMDGFLLQRKISDDWQEITKHSKIVHITQAKNGRSSLKYLLKYLTKMPEINGEIFTYNQMLKGTRLIQTFGTLYYKKPEPKKMVCDECGCDYWMSDMGVFKPDMLKKKMARELIRKREWTKSLENDNWEGYLTKQEYI